MSVDVERLSAESIDPVERYNAYQLRRGLCNNTSPGIVVVVFDDDTLHVQRIVLLQLKKPRRHNKSASDLPKMLIPLMVTKRYTKVNGSHHGDSPLLKPTGIQIATKALPGPANREHRKSIGRRQDDVFGYQLQ